MKKTKFSVGILAGGKSTRMGQNKALMEFNNNTLIGRISKEFKHNSEVLVSAAERGVYEELGFRVIYDEHKDIGPIEGIRRVLMSASEDYVFVCAADMPFVNREIAEYIAEFISSDYDCYVVADEERLHPLCAIYSKKVLPVIEELIAKGKYKLTEIFNNVRTKFISLEHTNFDRKVVRNVNTRDEFLKLSLPIVFTVSGYKNSGKTGLIEKLINEFIGDGYSVAVIKHDGHNSIEEVKGTDTERFKKAGAVCTVVYSDSHYVLSADRENDLPKNTDGDAVKEESSCDTFAELMIRQVSRQPSSPDVIILEGFKRSKYPKVEVVRREAHPESVADPDTLICIATDVLSPDKVMCPVYDLDDTKGIFCCVKKYFGI